MDKNPIPFEIPKTIIFINSKIGIRKAINQLQEWILKMSLKYIVKQIQWIVFGYYCSTSIHDQEKIYNKFKKSRKDFEICIVVTIELLGLGVDLSNIFCVV